jgi:hypothetical protein
MCGGKNSREVGQALKPGRQPEDKKPSVKGTPPMETPKVPDLTMIHADLLHYQPTQGCGNFVYKIFVLGYWDLWWRVSLPHLLVCRAGCIF